MVVHQQITHQSSLISSEQFPHENTQNDISHDIQNVLHLLQLGQGLGEQMHSPVQDLCEEVKRITQNRAYLQFDRKYTRGHPASLRPIFLSVQFGDITYGTLCVHTDQHSYPRPALALPVPQLLAQVCAFLLYSFEQSLFLQAQYEHLDHCMSGPLTKREREVLSFIYRGYNEEEIAKELSISRTTVNKHRQNIYGQLGVHNEYDARLVAYHMRMFPITDEYEQRK